jgi:hypothetical protein
MAHDNLLKMFKDALGNGAVEKIWRPGEPWALAVTRGLRERDEYCFLLENFMFAAHELIATAKGESCACGNPGCTETADAWRLLEEAGQKAYEALKEKP